MADSDIVNVRVGDIAAAFTEWDRQYREDPDGFWTDVEHLLGNTPESYGEACASYFLLLLNAS